MSVIRCPGCRQVMVKWDGSVWVIRSDGRWWKLTLGSAVGSAHCDRCGTTFDVLATGEVQIEQREAVTK